MKIVGIIQARTGSKRLPSKALLPLAGKPMIKNYIERVIRSLSLNEIILATTTKPEDQILCDIADACGIRYFKGSENDLVSRFYHCAKEHKADHVVRLCADNPCVEPDEIDRIVKYHIASGNEFSSNDHNVFDNGYPDGLGCEVYQSNIFTWLWYSTHEDEHREHPHKFIYENIEDFKSGSCKCPSGFSYPDTKLDVNTLDEYEYVRAIYDRFGHNKFHVIDYIHDLQGVKA